jgi:tetratricopeptide (TPR) repeat protein
MGVADDQTHFDFMTTPVETADLDRPTFEIVPAADASEAVADERGAEEWYQLGCSLEDAAADEAESAFQKALAMMPAHRGAHLALGYLLHQSGRLDEAVLHYRLAADTDQADGLAAFNLGVALEDLECPAEATRAYQRAVDADPELADAHYNLGRLCEEAGERTEAFEHFRSYKRIMES